MSFQKSHICEECCAVVDNDAGGYGQHDFGCPLGPWPDWKEGDPIPTDLDHHDK